MAETLEKTARKPVVADKKASDLAAVDRRKDHAVNVFNKIAQLVRKALLEKDPAKTEEILRAAYIWAESHPFFKQPEDVELQFLDPSER